MKTSKFLIFCFLLILGCSTSEYVPGPDKQMEGGMQGVLIGASSGAITGAEVTAATGPGAFIGAGLGFAAGALKGAILDENEEALAHIQYLTSQEQQRAKVHAILSKYWAVREELHPGREIYPASLFFNGDSVKLTRVGKMVLKEITRIKKESNTWSRLIIGVYVKSRLIENPIDALQKIDMTKDDIRAAEDVESQDVKLGYGEHLVTKRAVEIGNFMATSGINPRRIETRPIVMADSIIKCQDQDIQKKYSQSVEFIFGDR